MRQPRTPSVRPLLKPRGRPRSIEAKERILRAARQLLADRGPMAVTIEAVAERSGVGKPTIYRWWRDRNAVLMAALMEADSDDQRRTSPRSAIAALRSNLRAIARLFATPTGRFVAQIVATSDPNTELARAFRNHFILARREEGRAFLKRAIGERKIRSDADLDVALDMLYGPVFFRLLMGHAPLDEAFIDRAVAHALRGLKR